jgi:bisanhydrobacterioruberin hydratase
MDRKEIKISISIAVVTFFAIIGIVVGKIPEHLFHEQGSIFAISAIAIPVFYGMYKKFGTVGIRVMILLGIFSIAIETIGIYTGFPYSSFEYVASFGYRLFGTTPWPVFLAWSPIVIGVYTLSDKWFSGEYKKYLAFLFMLIAADLVLDPGAVARGLWTYDQGGFWYGVPLANFLGWVFSGSIAYFITRYSLKNSTPQKNYDLYVTLPLMVLIALWASVAFVYEITPVGIIGVFLVMSMLALLHYEKKTSII